MTDALEELLTRLRDDTTLRTKVEEATRQAAILPILRRIGWDVEDLREVEPEFKVAEQQVDYCLRNGERNAIFIECNSRVETLGSRST